jgi:hypothetical protein
MKNKTMRKCAHIACLCDVPDGENTAARRVVTRGSDDAEIACHCSHPACPLTFRWFASRSAANLASGQRWNCAEP